MICEKCKKHIAASWDDPMVLICDGKRCRWMCGRCAEAPVKHLFTKKGASRVNKKTASDQL